ncbi:MAG: tRNA dihydrouridine synthase DusB [Alphaproteobacteria bacterium]|nr:tRNA dihydrouridine synthase DusB [Alphaproteobacteria bacterium]
MVLKGLKVFLAPMAGITDAPMRRIVFEETGGKVGFFSEMVAVNALSYKNAKTYKIADVQNEPYPVTVQLMGGEPALFEDAAKLVADLGAVGIDINMGCPVRKIIASRAGADLMRDVGRAAEIIQTTVRATKLPVSVKFRKGWDSEHANAAQFAKMCEESGASFITVHGRTKAQGYGGTADWDVIRQVKSAVKIPVIGNGDVASKEAALKLLETTGADAVMIGRAALGNPWLLRDAADFLAQNDVFPVSSQTLYQTLLRHMAYLRDYYGDKTALGLSRKYICWYSKNFFEAKKFREFYMKINDFETAMDTIKTFFERAVKGEVL